MISGKEHFVVYNCPTKASVKVDYFQKIFLNINNFSSCIVHTLQEALVLLLFTYRPANWSSDNAFASGAGGHSVVNGSLPLRHFFVKLCCPGGMTV